MGKGIPAAGVPIEEPYHYEIRIEGHLTDRWTDWFEGLAIRHEAQGETTLSGPLCDQAALLGVLGKIQALNLTLISVNRSTMLPLSITGQSTRDRQQLSAEGE